MKTKVQRTRAPRKKTSVARFDEGMVGMTPRAILNLLREAGLLVLCGEPGCLYTGLAEEAIKCSGVSAELVFYRNFSCSSVEGAISALGRLAREVSKKSVAMESEMIVALDFVPPADEYEVARMAIAIEKIRKHGALILITVLPEARQLVEGLTDYLMVGSDELCERGCFGPDGLVDRAFNEMWQLSRGIPTLLQPLRAFSGWRGSGELPMAYNEAMRNMVELGLRPSLSTEELKLRLAITLLGGGAIEDLREILGGIDPAILEEMANWAPFYGVNIALGRFDCASDYSNGWLKLDLPILSSLVERHVDLAVACAEIMGDYGDAERLAAIIPILPREAQAHVVLKRGPELMDDGHLALVSKALAAIEELEMGREPGAFQLKRAVRAMSQVRLPDTYFDAKIPAGSKLEQSALLNMGILRVRGLLKGRCSKESRMSVAGSPLDKRLKTHEEAIRLLVKGSFREAMRLLVPYVKSSEVRSVSGCLLALDMEIAKALSCDVAWADRRVLDSCKAFLLPRGYEGLNGYLWCAEAVLEGLSASNLAKISAIEVAAAKAGEPVARAVAQLGGALVGLKKKPSAYVLAGASAAEASCKELGLEYAARVASLLKGAARFHLGERPRFYEVGGKDGFAMLAKLVYEAMQDSCDDRTPAEEVDFELPVDELWLLLSLSEGAGDFPAALDDQLPTAWRRGIEVARRTCLRTPRARPLGPANGAERERRVVRINLLGEYAVWAGGKRVPDWALEKRNGNTLLEHLVLQSNHLAGRARLASLIWPELDDEEKLSQKLYQATSSIRKALRLTGYGEELVVSNKATHVIALTPEYVRCDVDEFVACAKLAIGSKTDARTCEQALKAESLYTGDLYTYPNVESPFLARKRSELRRLYADAMVAGGEAAYRLGKKRHAYRLANNALLIDEIREDAEILVIKALRASGREIEARNRYRVYVEKLAQKLGKLPSKQVQDALNEPIGETAKDDEDEEKKRNCG